MQVGFNINPSAQHEVWASMGCDAAYIRHHSFPSVSKPANRMRIDADNLGEKLAATLAYGVRAPSRAVYGANLSVGVRTYLEHQGVNAK